MAQVEICTKISESVKMAGFLEKKRKMKLVSPWKKYWFVLEERLLLYYRSQIEYINLSPCRGSLNMGLVTTVRPGSSAGPCIIHIITRSQVVQLRAKNRATQEEWLQALLDSMSLPLYNKALKAPLTFDLHGHRYSMDNIHSHDRLKKSESEGSDRFYQSSDYRKNEISDSFYGGSLDTAIWSKNFKPGPNSGPNNPKAKVLEKILGYVEEADGKSMSDTISLIDDEDGGTDTNFEKRKHSIREKIDDDKKENEPKDKKFYPHDETKDFYNSIKTGRKSLSDNELNKMETLFESEKVKVNVKEESQFERIRNVMIKTKNKAFGNKTEQEKKTGSVKKRRQSFLQKVFRRYHKPEEKHLRENESEINDPLYDTIVNVQEQEKSLISSVSDSSLEHKDQDITQEESGVAVEDHISEDNDLSQKYIFGSKSILTAQAMSELKSKLKSRESMESQAVVREKKESAAPDLPPRRRYSRPKSPWHDVPVNNAPISVAEGNFNALGAVKFQDDIPPLFREPRVLRDVFDYEEETNRFPLDNRGQQEKPESADLSLLLEQLTEITAAPIVESESCDKNRSPGMDLDFWGKSRVERRFSDPDYDIPRPLKLSNLCISDESNKSPVYTDDNTIFHSIHSIEPDSLESAEKKLAKNLSGYMSSNVSVKSFTS